MGREPQSQGAIIYCRVSTLEQVENLSLKTQERVCREYCEREGYEVLQVFVEQGESAKTANRTQFIKALDFCARKPQGLSYFVVYAVNRFARNQIDHFGISAILKRQRITLRSATEPIDNSPIGEALEGVLSVFSQLDNRTRAERSRVGMHAALMEGRFVNKPPLGYQAPPAGQRTPSMVPDPKRASMIKAAFEHMATGHYSQREVLDYVNALGLRTEKGKRLTPETMRRILRNVTYTGRIRSKAHQIVVPGDFEPLVSDELFEMTQATIADTTNKKVSHVKQRKEFPLRGFIICCRCGSKLTGSTSKGNGGSYSYYRCIKNCVKARVELLHDQLAQLLRLLAPTAGLLRLWRAVVLDVYKTRHSNARAAKKGLQSRLDGLQNRKSKLLELYIAGKVDEETYQEQVDRYTSEIGAVRRELQKADYMEQKVEDVLDFAEHALRNAARLWNGFSLEQRHAFLVLMFPKSLTFDGEQLGTKVISPVFNMLRSSAYGESHLASPAGFEPA